MDALLLLRHGETPLNVTRVLQPADTPLSPTGRAQAVALARRLRALPLAGLVSSDLPRAVQTAETIASACGLPISHSPLLQERNFGDWRGRPYDSLGFDPLTMAGEPPGGESVPVFLARVARAFEGLLARQRELGGTLAVVSHGLVIKAMLEHHLRRPAGATLPERIANTSLTAVVLAPAPTARLIDCTAHLAGDTADDTRALSGG